MEINCKLNYLYLRHSFDKYFWIHLLLKEYFCEFKFIAAFKLFLFPNLKKGHFFNYRDTKFYISLSIATSENCAKCDGEEPEIKL